MWFQPVLAWMGVIGCVVVFAFSSAIWWDTPVDIAKIAVVYAVVNQNPFSDTKEHITDPKISISSFWLSGCS